MTIENKDDSGMKHILIQFDFKDPQMTKQADYENQER